MLITIVQSLCYLHSVRSLRRQYTFKFMTSCSQINCSHRANLVFAKSYYSCRSCKIYGYYFRKYGWWSTNGCGFLDLSKAFDTVNHSCLLLKLKSIGFSSHVCEWFKSYLKVTVVDNKQSSVKPVNVGVPQGSIFGPLLFIIYVNKLPNCITSCNISMYADDTVIYFSSKSVKDIDGKLNEDLANVQKWFTDNLL